MIICFGLTNSQVTIPNFLIEKIRLVPHVSVRLLLPVGVHLEHDAGNESEAI
jgi:hypothetical protein